MCSRWCLNIRETKHTKQDGDNTLAQCVDPDSYIRSLMSAMLYFQGCGTESYDAQHHLCMCILYMYIYTLYAFIFYLYI